MKVDKLRLTRFRNVKESVFFPDPRLNFLVGQNGQGKTSFLEALGFLSSLNSFRGSKSAEVVQWNNETAEVGCTLSFTDENKKNWETELKVGFQKEAALLGSVSKTSKTAFINGKPFKRSTSYLSQRFGAFHLGFHSVVFNPSDHDLVRGEPGIRRSYLDRVLAAEDIEYLNTFQKFKRVLEQRNALLRSDNPGAATLLPDFSAPLAELSALLVYKRLKWVEKLTQPLDDRMRHIFPLGENLKLIYLTNWAPEIEGLTTKNKGLEVVHFSGQGPVPSLEILEQAFWNQLSALGPAEWKVGHTLVGPHRDDWAFYLGPHPLRGHGSQGEVRSALVALKLAEIELFQNATGHRPVFLLDDFSSELDQERRSFLLKFLIETDLQVFVTTTEDRSLGGKKIWIENGNIRENDDRAGAEQIS